MEVLILKIVTGAFSSIFASVDSKWLSVRGTNYRSAETRRPRNVTQIYPKTSVPECYGKSRRILHLGVGDNM